MFHPEQSSFLRVSVLEQRHAANRIGGAGERHRVWRRRGGDDGVLAPGIPCLSRQTTACRAADPSLGRPAIAGVAIECEGSPEH